jgi:PadR family transcriptional regulator PadR
MMLSAYDLCILRALVDGEAAGLQIVDRMVADDTRPAGTTFDGRLYPALRDLEEEGYVVGRTGPAGDPSRGGRPRRYYRLTGQGKHAAGGGQ